MAQMGGLASALKAGHAEMARRGAKGAATVAARYGREHYVKAARARWDRHAEPTPGDQR